MGLDPQRRNVDAARLQTGWHGGGRPKEQPPLQGWNVALSADGNTALAGGYVDGGGLGAVWIWTRSAGVWTQQGSKLVGGILLQGYSVALSADGNTALVGGAGAALVYTRSGSVWSQQGNQLSRSGTAAGAAISTALSGDASRDRC